MSITRGNWIIEPEYIGPEGGKNFGSYRLCPYGIPVYGREFARQEAEANAKLMSAAPALAFACRQALEVLDTTAQPTLRLLFGLIEEAIELSGTDTRKETK